MKGLSIVSIALAALLGSVVQLKAAKNETSRGTAARSGTYMRPERMVFSFGHYYVLQEGEVS